MDDKLPNWMGRAFSNPRLAPYGAAAQGDALAAARLYWWNIEVSGALYGPLHCLELSLRNALHSVLTAAYGRADWWVTAPLNAQGARLVVKAERKCGRRGAAATPDGVVAQLSFGFWVALVSGGSAYDRLFWVPNVHKAFPHLDRPRRVLYEDLSSLVGLRNRIMHHEPVHHHPDLVAKHAKIYRMLGYISPELAREARALDRFPDVVAGRGAMFDGTRPPSF
ncbi:hypothetical protein [Streptomyces erythrochromogenes]|uniref:hypothetical protein n=1 Tax=Streptomyces erythrochromogenes TaxID=285574 RepID=UPI00386B98C7|nr:hypothetical protein OG489_18765 [Streptomyces erythrochromogenes]